MQYKILKSFKGSPDGARVLDFDGGAILEESADFPRSLIDVALAEGWIEEVEHAKPKKARGKK